MGLQPRVGTGRHSIGIVPGVVGKLEVAQADWLPAVAVPPQRGPWLLSYIAQRANYRVALWGWF